MANDFLALSISEKQPGTGKFNVIAMDTFRYRLYPIRLKKNEIISSDGRIIWDVGRITTAESVEMESESTTDSRNFECVVKNCRLSDEPVNLKRILEENSTDYQDFLNSPNMRFAIVKAREVLSIQLEKRTEDERPTCRIRVSFGSYNDKLLNKDYRWVNYWLWQYDHCSEAQLEENCSRYLQLLNRRGKTLYLILYRHYFKNGPQKWIAGMHWL